MINIVKVNSDKNLILMTRGDTLILKIDIEDGEGNAFIPDPNDHLRFALKKDYNDMVPLIMKDIPVDTCILRLESEETKRLEQPGEYYYDIQLTYADGIVSTIIPNAILKIKEEVE